jgi:hypothetical protein
MPKWKRYLWFFYLYFRYDFPEILRNVRRTIWNKRIKLWWYRLFLRKSEFDKSLDTDLDALMVMNKKEQEAYFKDIFERRLKAHNRDLAEEDHAREN